MIVFLISHGLYNEMVVNTDHMLSGTLSDIGSALSFGQTGELQAAKQLLVACNSCN